MIYQHRPQRFRYRTIAGKVKAVGTIVAGDWITIPESRHLSADKVVVEGWIPREYTAHHRDANGHWQSVRMSGGHLAQVRSLRTGRRYQLADHWLHAALDE